MSQILLPPILKGSAKLYAQRTHCSNGHIFEIDSMKNYKHKRRVCRTCDKIRKRDDRIKPTSSKIIREFCMRCDKELDKNPRSPKTIQKYCKDCYIIVNRIRSLNRYYTKTRVLA